MLARDIMTAPVLTAHLSTPLPEVARLMREHDIGCLPVVDESGVLIGLITESDFTGIRQAIPFSLALAPVIYGSRPPTDAELKQMLSAAGKLLARDIMTSDRLHTVAEDTPVGVLVHDMLAKKRKHFPVIRDGKIVGMVARHDLLKLIDRGIGG